MFIGSHPDSPPSLTTSGSQSTTSSNTATNNGAFQMPPRGLPSSIGTLDALFRDAGFSPPSKSKDRRLDEVVKVCVDILSWKSPQAKWEDLSKLQQVQLAFLVFKNQHKLVLKKHHDDKFAAANELCIPVFTTESQQNKALEAFLRPGGDDSPTVPSGGSQWIKFVTKHPEWRDATESCYTLFTAANSFGQLMEPFIGIQTANSKLCFIVSAANCILYYMLLTTGTKQEEGIEQYAINIGRFMRNNFTEDQIFRTIFCNDGGYPQHILESLLTHSTPPQPDEHKTRVIALHHEFDVHTSFQTIQCTLKSQGPILVSDFRVFPSYSDTSKTEFHGDWTDLKDSTGDQFHAFLIVGVRKTIDGSMGGIQFLVQDSMPGRPFVCIGFDLLTTMGVKKLVVVEEGVVFHGTTKDNELDDIPIYLTSGSPRKSAEGSFDATYSAEASRTEDEDEKRGVRVKLDYIGFDKPAGTDYSNITIIT